jgi:site-specific DNA-cytosine methylase
MIVLSLFDGIACGRLALERVGISVSLYLASETASDSIKIAKRNFPDIVELGDVRCLDVGCLPKVDLLIGGSPCQDLTRLRNGDGLSGTKSSLLFEFVRLLQAMTPKYFLLENVIPRRREWVSIINNLTGSTGRAINSDLFVPQNRPRMYWTNIHIAHPPPRPAWDFEFWQYRRTYFRKNKSGVCPCLTANMGTGGHNVPLRSPDLADRLSPEDCEEMQGLPRGYTFGVCNSRLYRVVGDGWTVPVISHIFSSLSR